MYDAGERGPRFSRWMSRRLADWWRKSASGWPDSVAMAAVIAAVLTMVWELGHVAEFLPSLGLRSWRLPIADLVLGACSTAAVVGVAWNRRMLAALSAWGTVAALIGFEPGPKTLGVLLAIAVVPALPAAVLLTICRSPRRGLDLVGRRLLIAVVVLGATISWGSVVPFGPPHWVVAYTEALPGLLLLVVCPLWHARRPGGGRCSCSSRFRLPFSWRPF